MKEKTTKEIFHRLMKEKNLTYKSLEKKYNVDYNKLYSAINYKNLSVNKLKELLNMLGEDLVINVNGEKIKIK